MGLIFLVGLGSVLGWLAAIIARTRSSHGLMVNVVAGITGALIAGLLVNPLTGQGNILSGRYSAETLLVCLGGSLVLLISVNLLRCGELR